MAVVSVLIICALIAGILLAIELGHRIALRRHTCHPTAPRGINSTIEAAVFGLMGLLIGFTFYGAGSRFDARRNLIVREANAISTAYLRIDLLPAESQPQIRDDFRTYLQSRLAIYHNVPDVKAVRAAIDYSTLVQEKMWKNVVTATKASGPADKSLLLASVNETIDITTDRTVALMTHPPSEIFVMLAMTVLTCSVLSGYTMAASPVRDWVSRITFAVVVGIALYVTVDYEFPRIGLIRIDPVDQVLVDTLKEMK